MMQYEIKEPKGFGSTWIKVIDKNSIKELADLIEKENEFKFEIYQ